MVFSTQLVKRIKPIIFISLLFPSLIWAYQFFYGNYYGSTVTKNNQTSRVAGTGSQGCDTHGNYPKGVETRATPEGSLKPTQKPKYKVIVS